MPVIVFLSFETLVFTFIFMLSPIDMSNPEKAGAYKVNWHAAASDDGHKTSGTLAFTVK
jgi:hypothetical protein